MKPTIEDVRASVRERYGNAHAVTVALLAALDVAEAAALDEMPHRAVREAEEKFRTTSEAPSKPEGT